MSAESQHNLSRLPADYQAIIQANFPDISQDIQQQFLSRFSHDYGGEFAEKPGVIPAAIPSRFPDKMSADYQLECQAFSHRISEGEGGAYLWGYQITFSASVSSGWWTAASRVR